MNKLIVLIVSLIMAFAIFAACGTETAGGDDGRVQSESAGVWQIDRIQIGDKILVCVHRNSQAISCNWDEFNSDWQ